MRKLLTIFFFLLAFSLNAADYYVSFSEGSDTNNGTSKATPWKTLQKIEDFAASPGFALGDNIYLKRGDTWNDNLVATHLDGTSTDHFVLAAYGYGENPVINGTIDISSGWTLDAANIYVKNATAYPASTDMVGVILDGDFIGVSRYPNPDDATPFLTNDYSHEPTDKSRLRDDQLPGLFIDNYWQGAKIGFRTKEWIFDIREVTSHAGIQINLSSNLVYAAEIGYGYIFMNDYNAIDQDTEWYWDKTARNLYMQLDTDPNTHTIEMVKIDKLLDLDSCDYITVHDITFRGAKNTAVEFTNSKNVNFYRNKILMSGKNAMFVNTTKFMHIHSDTIMHTQNNAMEVNADMVNIHDNYVYNTAMVIGMGASDNGQYMACKITGTNGTFRYNHVINSGYNAIHWGKGPWTISYNYVDGFCGSKRDGGGIYTFDTEDSRQLSRVTNNIVLNGLGDDIGGVPDDHYYGTDMGLYPDGGTARVTWKDNVVGYAGTGIFNHIGSYEVIENNLVVGSRTSSIRFTYDLGGPNPESTGNIIQNNIMVHGNDQYAVFPVWSEISDASQFGTFDNNTHIVPLSSTNIQSPWLTSYEASNASDQRHYNQRTITSAPYWNADTLSSYHKTRFTVSTVGSNLAINSTMDNTPNNNSGLGRTNASSASFSVSKITSGVNLINGATFEAKFTSPGAGDKGEITHKNLSLTKGNWYRVKISVKSNIASTVVFRLRTGSVGTLHTVRPLNTETTVNNYVFVLKARETNADCRVFLDFKDTGATVWIDDFFVEPITTMTEKTYTDYVHLEVNPSKTTKSFTLSGGPWKDIYGATVTFPVNIDPYGGKVFLKQ